MWDAQPSMVAQDLVAREVVARLPRIFRGGVTVPTDFVQKVTVFVRVGAVGIARLVCEDLVHGERVGAASVGNA